MQTLCDYYIELRIYPGNCLQTVSQMYSLILRFNKQLFIETINSRMCLYFICFGKIRLHMHVYACTYEGTEVGTKVIYRIFGVDNDYLQSTQLHIFLGIAISRANKSNVRI